MEFPFSSWGCLSADLSAGQTKESGSRSGFTPDPPKPRRCARVAARCQTTAEAGLRASPGIGGFARDRNGRYGGAVNCALAETVERADGRHLLGDRKYRLPDCHAAMHACHPQGGWRKDSCSRNTGMAATQAFVRLSADDLPGQRRRQVIGDSINPWL
ncbi:hypothetical protein Q4543_23530 [Salipiger sp. 1_MG-2023]|nr:hypothetical protein [Salipiger sp. 1_MG-2023]